MISFQFLLINTYSHIETRKVIIEVMGRTQTEPVTRPFKEEKAEQGRHWNTRYSASLLKWNLKLSLTPIRLPPFDHQESPQTHHFGGESQYWVWGGGGGILSGQTGGEGGGALHSVCVGGEGWFSAVKLGEREEVQCWVGVEQSRSCIYSVTVPAMVGSKFYQEAKNRGRK